MQKAKQYKIVGTRVLVSTKMKELPEIGMAVIYTEGENGKSHY